MPVIKLNTVVFPAIIYFMSTNLMRMFQLEVDGDYPFLFEWAVQKAGIDAEIVHAPHY